MMGTPRSPVSPPAESRLPLEVRANPPGRLWSAMGRARGPYGDGEMNAPFPKSQLAVFSSNIEHKEHNPGVRGKKVPPSPPVQTQPVKTRWLTSKARLVLQTPSGWCKTHVFDRWSFRQECLPSLALPVGFLQTDCSAHPRAPCQPTAYLKHGSSGRGAPRRFFPPLRGVMRHSPLLAVRSEPLWEKNLLKPADVLALSKLGAKTLPASQACTAALLPPWPASDVPPALQLCSGCPDTTHLYFLYLKRPLKWASGHLSHPSGKSWVYFSIKSWVS